MNLRFLIEGKLQRCPKKHMTKMQQSVSSKIVNVFHAIRVWLLGIFCLLKKINAEDAFITKLGLDGGAKPPSKIDFFEYISMWTIAALCHDLGYPLEKAEQCLS